MNDTLKSMATAPNRSTAAELPHEPVGRSNPATLSLSAETVSELITDSTVTKHLLGAAVFLTMAAVFVLWGATRLDIGHQEARAAMAAREPLGAVGQSFGGLDPSVYPGSVALTKIWTNFEDNGPGRESVRWPAAILAIAIGIVLALQSEGFAGKIPALWVSLCWFSSLAVMNRSGEYGIDMVAGFGLIIALDRCIARQGRADWITGLFTSAAFLCAGLPPVILVTAASIVLCRSSVGLSLSFLGIVLATIGGWSAWALSEISAEAWAAAIALPVAFRSGSGFPTIVLSLSLPMVLTVPAALTKSARNDWTESRTEFVNGWWTIAALSLFVGTILPQFTQTALLPVVAGCAVVAGNAWASVLKRPRLGESGFAGRWLAIATGLTVGLAAIAGIPTLVYVSMTIPYFRTISMVCVVILCIAVCVYVSGLAARDLRRVALAFVLTCVAFKVVHTSIYVPEWNYRRGQGPWGRAVGQWVPEGWPIYTLHGWPTDFAFATGHNFRQITHPRFLPDPTKTPDGRPSFILLHPADFQHWPKTATPLIKVFEFHDSSGDRVSKVLARTGPEKPAWQKLIYQNPLAR